MPAGSPSNGIDLHRQLEEVEDNSHTFDRDLDEDLDLNTNIDLSNTWFGSSERTASLRRAIPWLVASLASFYGGLLCLVDRLWVTINLGLSYRLVAYLSLFLIGTGLVFTTITVRVITASRLRFESAQERKSRGFADRALDEIAGPEDLIGFIRANRKQMDTYEALARSQARTSYRASQAAMGFGLLVIGAGVAIVVSSDSAATKYAAAVITAVGAATGGYISRTYLAVQQNATRQMNFYFRQPLVQSYILQSERPHAKLSWR